VPGGPDRPLGPEPPSGSEPGEGLGAGPLIPPGSSAVPLPSFTPPTSSGGVTVLAEGVEVFAADEQHTHPVDTMRWVHLAQAVLAAEGVRGEAELSMLFVDEASIGDLNKRFLGKDGPTDVLAFPIDEEPAESGRSPDSGGTGPGFTGEIDEAPTLLGDVVICPSVAARNAPEHAGTYEDELALLVVHGILHLLGMDHLEDDEAEAMEARERELLATHHRPVDATRADREDGESGRTPLAADGSGPVPTPGLPTPGPATPGPAPAPGPAPTPGLDGGPE
jgi:probable rRNA maturation factor